MFRRKPRHQLAPETKFNQKKKFLKDTVKVLAPEMERLTPLEEELEPDKF